MGGESAGREVAGGGHECRGEGTGPKQRERGDHWGAGRRREEEEACQKGGSHEGPGEESEYG